VDLLLQALRCLGDEDWCRVDEVRIAGGGPLEAAVHEAVDDLRGRGRPVTTLGYLDAPAAAELLGWTDWVVIPSRVESVPLVYGDAVQAGRGVVVTPVGDLPELVSGTCAGVVAGAPTAAGLAEALRRGLGGDPRVAGRGAAAAAAEFSVDRIAAGLLDALR
jgi:glycosyltransferase involved in cell wall biosynthesis